VADLGTVAGVPVILVVGGCVGRHRHGNRIVDPCRDEADRQEARQEARHEG
jgi:hypothetical protein